MFAVIMGMGAFAPALADNSGSNGQKTMLCHFQEEVLDENGAVLEEASVSIIEVNDRALDTHLAHLDWIIDDSVLGDGNDSTDCPVTPDVDEV